MAVISGRKLKSWAKFLCRTTAASFGRASGVLMSAGGTEANFCHGIGLKLSSIHGLLLFENPFMLTLRLNIDVTLCLECAAAGMLQELFPTDQQDTNTMKQIISFAQLVLAAEAAVSWSEAGEAHFSIGK